MALTRSTQGILILGVLGLILLIAAWFLLPVFQDHQEVVTSDAANAKGTILIGSDSFAGYGPACSSRMRKLMLADGYLPKCVDDQANYTERLAKLERGDIQFAFVPVDAYVLEQNYSGVIAAVIDESNGADGLVCQLGVAESIAELRNVLDIKVAYTPGSPSDHMRKVLGVHFDIPLFRSADPAWQVQTNGSEEALKKLTSGEAQCAFLWEPDLIKATQMGMTRLIDSSDMTGVIVDTLAVNRSFYDGNPEIVGVVLANYFKTLKFYRDNPGALHQELAKYSGVTKEVAAQMVQGINWVNLEDNATKWFGQSTTSQLGSHGLVDVITRTVDILNEAGDFSGNPLPQGDPRRVINSSQIALLWNQGIKSGHATGGFLAAQASTSLETVFTPLTEAGWKRLKHIGPLKARNVLFQSGSSALTLDDKKQLDSAAEALKSYPNFRIEIQGHTPKGGDEAANVELSQQRADSISRYLQITYNMDPDRVRAVGKGSSEPPQRKQGESFRAYRGRQARVEIHLKSEVY